MKRFTVARLMVAVAFVAVWLGFCIVPVWRQAEFHRLARQIDEPIRKLRATRPYEVSPSVWECAHNWTITAYCNVCFSPGHVRTEEMYRLREDVRRKLEGEINLDTLEWIWDRLAQTGPHGKRYVERFRPRFQECFPKPAASVTPGMVPSTVP
jgi:hypothetical protein